MGKIQCISSKQGTPIEVIERSLKNAHTSLEKNIRDEYFSLKLKYSQKADTSEKIKLKNFVKWYKVLYCECIFTKRTSAGECNSHLSKKGLDKSDSLSTSSNYNSENLTVYYCERRLRKLYSENKEKIKREAFLGPPESLRWYIWLTLAGLPVDRSKDYFELAYLQPLDIQVESQIRKDLSRTMTEESHSHLQIEGIEQVLAESLYKVLRAFANIDKEVSYCQGMNFIAGFFLVNSNFNTKDTFFLLLSLFSKSYSNVFGMRGFFISEFPLLRAYTYVFNVCFEKKVPRLKKHFTMLEIPDEVWISKWIQTTYTVLLPYEATLRFYDCIFSYGLWFIVNLSIALVKSFESELVLLQDSSDVIEYFKTNFSQIEMNKVEDVVNYAKKLITQEDFYLIIKEYETINEVDVSCYDMTYLQFRQCQDGRNSVSIEDSSILINKNTDDFLNVVNGLYTHNNSVINSITINEDIINHDKSSNSNIQQLNYLNYNICKFVENKVTIQDVNNCINVSKINDANSFSKSDGNTSDTEAENEFDEGSRILHELIHPSLTPRFFN